MYKYVFPCIYNCCRVMETELKSPPKLAPSPPDAKGFNRTHQPFNFNDQLHNHHLNPNPNPQTKNNDAAGTGHPTPFRLWNHPRGRHQLQPPVAATYSP